MKVKLCDVFDLQMGKTPSRNNLEYWNGEHKWVAIGDLGDIGKYISHTKECISDAGVAESGIKPVPAGTVIMSFKLSIGKTAITSEEIYTNEAIMAFIDKNAYPIDVNYIYHLFSGMDWYEGSNKAVMGVTLNKATLSQKTINIPDINEQRSVALILDKLDDLIFLRKQQLAKLDELVKTRFMEMFGDIPFNTNEYPTAKLGDIAFITKLAGFEYTAHIHYKDSGDIIMIRGLNCKKAKLILDDVHWIDQATSDLLPRSKLFAGDIVMTYVGTVGEVAIIDADDRYHLAPNVAKISLYDKTSYVPQFFVYMFMYCRDYIMKHASSTTQAALSMGKMRDIVFPIPPTWLQKQFAEWTGKVSDVQLTIQQSLDKLEVLKKSLMQEYFG